MPCPKLQIEDYFRVIEPEEVIKKSFRVITPKTVSSVRKNRNNRSFGEEGFMGQTERKSYNSYGQLATETDFKGIVTSCSYDSFGRIINRAYHGIDDIFMDGEKYIILESKAGVKAAIEGKQMGRKWIIDKIEEAIKRSDAVAKEIKKKVIDKERRDILEDIVVQTKVTSAGVQKITYERKAFLQIGKTSW